MCRMSLIFVSSYTQRNNNKNQSKTNTIHILIYFSFLPPFLLLSYIHQPRLNIRTSSVVVVICIHCGALFTCEGMYIETDDTEELLFVTASSFFPNIILYYYLFLFFLSLLSLSRKDFISFVVLQYTIFFLFIFSMYKQSVFSSFFIYFFRIFLQKYT